jgi:hypothetical protein
MTLPVSLLAAAMLFASPVPAQQDGPPPQSGPIRATFLTATETVLDAASAIDPSEPDAQFAAQLARFKELQQTLHEMAFDEREQDIVAEAGNIPFTLTSCHLQAQGDISRLPACKGQVDRSLRSVMRMLNMHKSNGAWVAGTE